MSAYTNFPLTDGHIYQFELSDSRSFTGTLTRYRLTNYGQLLYAQVTVTAPPAAVGRAYTINGTNVMGWWEPNP